MGAGREAWLAGGLAERCPLLGADLAASASLEVQLLDPYRTLKFKHFIYLCRPVQGQRGATVL